jgi:hypothetical protein
MGLRPALVYLEHKVNLPHPNPTKLDQIRENITYLTNLKLSAKIDTASADNLILDQRHLHDSIFEEMKLLYSQDVAPEVSIHISGGLSPLPGTDIIMPQINGVIDAVAAVPEVTLPVTDVAAPDPATLDSVAVPESVIDPPVDPRATDSVPAPANLETDRVSAIIGWRRR